MPVALMGTPAALVHGAANGFTAGVDLDRVARIPDGRRRGPPVVVPAAIPRRGPKDMRAILALQRLAGNAAVVSAVTPKIVQRCGGEVHPGCSCAEEKPQEFRHAQRLVVQRADIDFRPLTWADFKGSPSSGFPATTRSDIRKLPNLKQAKEIVDTGTDCTPPKAKQRKTEFTVKISVDPAMFDNVKAFFSQEQSGAEPDLKKGLVAATARQVTKCQREFDRQLAEFKTQAAADCKTLAGQCKQAFKSGSTSFTMTVGATAVTATSAKDCAKSFVTDCKAAELAGFTPGSFTFTHTAGGSATAATRADCVTSFKASVDTIDKAESARLLNHEQVHFNVTNSIATKLQADLRAAAATMSVEMTECGKAKALASAATAFAALNPATRLTELFNDARKDLKTKQKDYDDSTNHGLIQKEQDKWNKNFP
jgi:hypothetical protein